MKAILEFSLPDEREEYDDAIKGGKYIAVINDLAEYLRRKLKYEELPGQTHAAFEQVRDELARMKDEYGVGE